MTRYNVQDFRKRARLVMVLAAAVVSLATSARGQSRIIADDDPVATAMKRVEALTNQRARAAEAVLAGAKLVDESKTARKQGDRAHAIATLKQAQNIAAAVDALTRSALIR